MSTRKQETANSLFHIFEEKIRNPKQGYQCPPQKDVCHLEILFNAVDHQKKSCWPDDVHIFHVSSELNIFHVINWCQLKLINDTTLWNVNHYSANRFKFSENLRPRHAPWQPVIIRDTKTVLTATVLRSTTGQLISRTFLVKHCPVFPILHCIHWIRWIRWIFEFNENQPSMTEGYWQIFCVSLTVGFVV